jgi:hypothetical protein
MGPITIFDKSALQALSIDETVWLEAYFLTNVTPLFYVETLADLEKAVAEGRTSEKVVASLAEKTPSDAYPNAAALVKAPTYMVGSSSASSARRTKSSARLGRAPGTLNSLSTVSRGLGSAAAEHWDEGFQNRIMRRGGIRGSVRRVGRDA